MDGLKQDVNNLQVTFVSWSKRDLFLIMKVESQLRMDAIMAKVVDVDVEAEKRTFLFFENFCCQMSLRM